MLGAVNIPCETAIEFYATPDLESRNRAKDVSSTPSILSTQLSCGSEKSMDGYVAISGQKRIFSKRRSSQVDYLKDGRKVLDGTVLEVYRRRTFFQTTSSFRSLTFPKCGRNCFFARWFIKLKKKSQSRPASNFLPCQNLVSPAASYFLTV